MRSNGARVYARRLFLSAALWLGFSASEAQSESIHPSFPPQRIRSFLKGERTAYRASWNGIPVASAEIRGEPQLIEGKKFFAVKVEASSRAFLAPIWKMRDSIESLFELETLHPRRFVFQQRENKRKIDTTAVFDPVSHRWQVNRQQGSKLIKYDFVSSQTLDPILAVYMARSLDFKVGDQIRMEVFGGKSRYIVNLDVEAREKIRLSSGEVDAYRVVPRVRNLNRSGYAERFRESAVWISADEKRVPLRMVSEVFIGSVRIEMVDDRS